MPIRIFIDQGHNPSGPNAGAEGNGLREQDVTYNVGIYLAELLNDDPRFTARTSRTTPTESLGTSNAGSLQQRDFAVKRFPGRPEGLPCRGPQGLYGFQQLHSRRDQDQKARHPGHGGQAAPHRVSGPFVPERAVTGG